MVLRVQQKREFQLPRDRSFLKSGKMSTSRKTTVEGSTFRLGSRHVRPQCGILERVNKQEHNGVSS
jgi:hypothetical protein